MNKLWMIAIFCTLLSACASYTPIVDTKGKAKFETSNAEELSNDKILCAKLAKNNSSFLSNIGFWIQVLKLILNILTFIENVWWVEIIRS